MIECTRTAKKRKALAAKKMTYSINPSLPIGIFDSGVGGLTVFSAIAKTLPEENLLYLGDTARLPYGTKSSETIERYALQATQKLVERKVKALVIACNTATAAALPALQKKYPAIPVIGVVEPGANAAVQASQNGNILVLATEATIKNQAYQRAILTLSPNATVSGIACSLFVALAEEGWATQEETDVYSQKSVAQIIAARYLHHLFHTPSQNQQTPDCIVLGCTHFPPLAPAIQTVVGHNVAIVDSAKTTALALKNALEKLHIRSATSTPGTRHFLTTDAPQRFARVGGLFLQTSLNESDIELVCL